MHDNNIIFINNFLKNVTTITFSIIIPFKNWSSDLEECSIHIKGLSL